MIRRVTNWIVSLFALAAFVVLTLWFDVLMDILNTVHRWAKKKETDGQSS